MTNLILLGIAGGLGTIARYGLGKWINFEHFPFVTLCINSFGSLFLGYLFIKYAEQNSQWYLALGVGFCGGFTTFSAFSLELYKMLTSENYLHFAMYLSATVLFGILCVVLGVYLGKNIL